MRAGFPSITGSRSRRQPPPQMPYHRQPRHLDSLPCAPFQRRHTGTDDSRTEKTSKIKIYRLSKKGEPYGWPVTIYDLPVRVFGEALCGPGREISPRAAAGRIAGRVLELNPAAQERDIRRFLTVI